jgi:hypothetical protein
VQSSSHRELLAIERTLNFITKSKELIPAKWTTLWWLTANSNVEKMIAKRRGKLLITRLVLEILKKGRMLKFQIEPVWVSRDNPFLQKADCLSKGINLDNWEIKYEDFMRLNGEYGPFSIDLFATSKNAKCEQFYLRSFQTGTLGVDSYAQN